MAYLWISQVHDIPVAHYRYVAYLRHIIGTWHTYTSSHVHGITMAHYMCLTYLWHITGDWHTLNMCWSNALQKFDSELKDIGMCMVP